jgi:hypothetical protein
MDTDQHEHRDIVRYVEIECRPHKVEHAEKLRSESVWGLRHDLWDVRLENRERYWVITNPTNLYSQDDFPSLDMAFVYHVGLRVVLARRQSQKAPDYTAGNLTEAWRVYEDAAKSLADAQEPQDFQAVGARLREALLAAVTELSDQKRLPPDVTAPKAADFLAWTSLVASYLAPGHKGERMRDLLTNAAREAWQFVSWLTHAKNALRVHGELAITAVSDVITMFGLVDAEASKPSQSECPQCGSYRLRSVFRPQMIPADRVADPAVKAETLFCPACGWEESWTPVPEPLRAYGGDDPSAE